jgi:hypothetical protein
MSHSWCLQGFRTPEEVATFGSLMQGLADIVVGKYDGSLKVRACVCLRGGAGEDCWGLQGWALSKTANGLGTFWPVQHCARFHQLEYQPEVLHQANLCRLYLPASCVRSHPDDI